jgi:hypothetical protein
MKCGSRRIRALLLLFVTITSLVMVFGENVLCAGELPGAHEQSNTYHAHDTEQIHGNSCPDAPATPLSTIDHFCLGDCGCPCQAPLTSSAMKFSHVRTFTYLYPAEISQFIPEVYLSLFVPPDSATA